MASVWEERASLSTQGFFSVSCGFSERGSRLSGNINVPKGFMASGLNPKP